MQLRVVQSIVNDNYKFVFSIDPTTISDDDYKRVKKFGAPSINFGGSFGSGETAYTLPDEFIDLPDQFPVTKTFSLVAPFDTDGLSKLDTYRTTITTRLSDAVVALRALADTFTNEYLTTI